MIKLKLLKFILLSILLVLIFKLPSYSQKSFGGFVADYTFNNNQNSANLGFKTNGVFFWRHII